MPRYLAQPFNVIKWELKFNPAAYGLNVHPDDLPRPPPYSSEINLVCPNFFYYVYYVDFQAITG
jgi:hypothetical protein